MIVRSDDAVTLLGAGTAESEDLALALDRAPCLVAADSGAALALELGIAPEAVIGDLDSLPEAARRRIPPERIHRIDEQDSTDFDKCLRNIAAPAILGVGFLGARVDHELAAMNALVRRPERRCILIGSHDLVFAAPREICLNLPPGTRVSLFPLAPVEGRSEGLRWPIGGLSLRPDGRVGTSNHSTGPVRLAFAAPGMLVILPLRQLDAAIAGLLASDPAR